MLYRTVQRIENWPTAVGLRLRPSPGFRRLSFRNGIKTHVRGNTLDWEVVKELALADAYERVLDHLAGLPGKPVVLDFGANIGIFSLLAALAHPDARIFAYEPAPPNLEIMELNRQANAELSRRIEVRAEAVGGETRKAEFCYNEANPAASGICYATGTSYQVQIRSFAEVLASLPGPVDVAKIDIEGAEFEILEKTPPELWRRVSVICIEIHDDPSGKLSRADYLRKMAECGYTHQHEPVGNSTFFLKRR